MRRADPAPAPPLKKGAPSWLSYFCVMMINISSPLGAEFCMQLWLGPGRGKAFLTELVGEGERSSSVRAAPLWVI